MKKNENYKLMPELNSNWGANVRNLLPPKRWDEIRRESYKRAGYKCEICGENGLDQGFKHPVECHEVWSWNRSSNIQKLERMISLCPLCHHTKHFGFHGEQEAVERLMKVNNISELEAKDVIWECKEAHAESLGIKWTVDLTEINEGVWEPKNYEKLKSFDDFKRCTTLHYKIDDKTKLGCYKEQTREHLEKLAKRVFKVDDISDPEIQKSIIQAEKRRDQQIKKLSQKQTPT